MKILKTTTILILVALLMACSMKKPDANNMVSDVKVDVRLNTDKNGDPAPGFDTYIATFKADLSGVKPSSTTTSGIPKLVEFESIITFDTSKKAFFESNSYPFQIFPLSGPALPSQVLGGMSYYDYMTKTLPKETINGIVQGVTTTGLNSLNLKNGVKTGNDWLDAVTNNKNKPLLVKPEGFEEAKKAFPEYGVKYDQVTNPVKVIEWAIPPA